MIKTLAGLLLASLVVLAGFASATPSAPDHAAVEPDPAAAPAVVAPAPAPAVAAPAMRAQQAVRPAAAQAGCGQ